MKRLCNTTTITFGLSSLLVPLLLVGCLADRKEHIVFENVEIIEAAVAGKKLYIPNVYVRFNHTSIGDNSGLLQTYYPGSMPVLGDPLELWWQGEWRKNITVYYEGFFKRDIRKALQELIAKNSAHKSLGKEFGLLHLTQVETQENFKDDIWIADARDGQFIICNERQAKLTALCSYNLVRNEVYLRVVFDKQYLPEWKLIRNNVNDLFDSFGDPKTAKEYLVQYYPERQFYRFQRSD